MFRRQNQKNAVALIPMQKVVPLVGFLIARYDDGRLYQCDGKQLVCLDVTSGQKLWTYKPQGNNLPNWYVIGDGTLYVAESTIPWMSLRGSMMFQIDHIVACDAKTGQEFWRHSEFSERASTRLVYADGDLFVPHFGKASKRVSKKKINKMGYSKDYHQNWHVLRLDGQTGAKNGRPIRSVVPVPIIKWVCCIPSLGFIVVGGGGFRVNPETGKYVDGFGFASLMAVAKRAGPQIICFIPWTL